RGVELLVRGLELLVAREDLLVRRLELLVRRLELLDDRLQVVPAARELVLEPREVVRRYVDRLCVPASSLWGCVRLMLARRGARDVLEEDEEVVAIPGDHRNDLDIHRPQPPVVPHAKLALPHRLPVLPCVLQRRPEPEEEPLSRHLEEAQARIAGRGLEERA